MYPHPFAALWLLASVAAAKVCINATVPVTISAREATFGNLATPQTNVDAIAFALNLTRQGQNFTDVVLTGYHTQSGTYNISTQFCVPDSIAKGGWGNASTEGGAPIVQVLTHGIGFDKT
jgi:hypothetical protein